MTTIADRLDALTQELAQTAAAAGRDPEALTLIAVSKRHGEEAIRAAAAAGQRDFGENYLQEALVKIEALADLELCWHFIGRIQSNKTQPIARHFDWVHTVDRLKIAERLARARREHSTQPLNLCLQVNIDADPNKAGVSPSELPALATGVNALDGVTARGLMTILDPDADPATSFSALHALYEKHRDAYGWDTLSMGMSGDYPAAIAAGATQLRIGTAIFGPRPAAPITTETTA